MDEIDLCIVYNCMDRFAYNYKTYSRTERDKKATDKNVREFLELLLPKNENKRIIFSQYYNKIKEL